MVGIEMFHRRVAPSQRIGRIDLHLKEALNKPGILLLRRFVEVQPFHRRFKSARSMTKCLWQRQTGQVNDDGLLTLALRCLFIGGFELRIAWSARKPNFGHSFAAIAIDELSVLDARRNAGVADIFEWSGH
ncbi:hypothetical protein NKI01_24185 [Mesorhizobium sp. M0815]|uniref:hypothetical protein n=1 Tax=Mesorhizobium sp. M0815 TaxID=2957005 RepID=UPI0033391E78